MIRTIFFPDTIGSYPLFGKRTVGFDGDFSTKICATVSYQKGNQRIVEKIITQDVTSDQTVSQEQRIVEALTAVSQQLGPYDSITCTLPSGMVIFKELSLPFNSLKKIKSILPFEVESLLPFTIDKAVIDCIITHKEVGKSQVLVCAVQQDLIDRYTNYFTAAGMTLNRISVDLLALQGIYQLTGPSENNYCLVSTCANATRLGLVINGQLITVRALNKGIAADASPASLSSLFLEIQRTLDSYRQSYVQQLPSLDQCVLQGTALSSCALKEFLEKDLGFTLSYFEPELLNEKKVVENKADSTDSCLISLAASFDTEQFKEFNLLTEQARKEEDRVLSLQLITAASLILFIFISFFLYSFLRIRALKNASKSAQTEAITELKKQVKLKASQTVNLDAANKAALLELKKQQSAWRNLSEENRYAFLRTLTELSKCVNAKEVRLDLATLYMKDDIIKLYGSVPGYQQLTLLQTQLECPAFKKLPKLQDWNFKTEPITLILNRQEI